MSSGVAEFYRDRTVLLTGGTGFVGLAVVEKLLRSTQVSTIYLLMRQKKGMQAADRLKDYAKNPVFERLKKEKGDSIFAKVKAVGGDVGAEDLGLSSQDKATLLSQVEVVIHCAATLDFQADLRETVQINLLGTRRLLQLAQEIPQIKSFVHVSSAYVNSHLREVKEKIYPVPAKAEEVIALAQSVSDQDLESETKKLLGEYVNTYTFTKALAEEEVVRANQHFPTVIVRPSMIVAAWKEPVEGWTCSKNGPQGFIMGAGKGVVRRLPVDPEIVTDYIPVDTVVNGILVAGSHAALKRASETEIFHLTSSTYKPFRWNLVTPYLQELVNKYPLQSAVWYPTLKFLPSLFLFRLSALFFHWIPAYILDSVTRLAGGRPILVKLHTNIGKSLALLEPFIFTEWFFDNSATMELHNGLSPEDKELFTLDIGPIDWPQYFEGLVKGVKVYLQNEPLSNYPKAAKKQKVLVKLHTNIGKSLALLEPFIFTEWFFDNSATMELHNGLSPEDKELFTLDIGPIDWPQYFEGLVKGVKVYLQNEPLSNYPKAAKKQKVLRVLNGLLQVLVVLSLWWLVTLLTGKSYIATSIVVPLLATVLNLL